MTNQRNNLIARLAIPLLGLLITAQFLLPEKRIEATASTNDGVEQLMLTGEDGINVVRGTVYSKERLFDHNFYKECFENRQVWASFQLLKTGRHTVCLYFVDFRDSDESKWAKERLDGDEAEFVNRESAVFGTVLVYVQGSPDTPKGVMEGVLQTVGEKVN